jgi:hypothetical protein
MKKFAALMLLFIALTSFKTNEKYPCHPAGDLYPCTHPVHMFDYDVYGNTYPCTHPVHPLGDLYPCIHNCY